MPYVSSLNNVRSGDSKQHKKEAERGNLTHRGGGSPGTEEGNLEEQPL